MEAGTVGVLCPSCSETIDILVTCEIVNNELAHEGLAQLVCTPQMHDLWAHMWIHSGDAA